MSVYFELLKLIVSSKNSAEFIKSLLKKAAEMRDSDRT